MANIKTGTGSSIAIGTILGTPNGLRTEYEADTYTVIGETTTIPELGDERSNVEFVALADGRKRKARGVADAGGGEIIFGHKTGDAGQVALKAAFNATSQSTDEFNFRVQFNDSLGLNPTTRYFRARVGSMRVKEITNDGIVLVGAMLEVNTAVLEVDAA
jgi:hypothetical protein